MNYKDYPTVYSHPEVDAILNTLNFDRDTLLSIKYVLKVLANKYHLEEKKLLDNRYKSKRPSMPDLWLPAQFFEYLLSSHLYTKRMKMMVDAGILIEDFKGSSKGRHPLYKLRKRKWYRGYSITTPILSPRVIKKIATYSKWRIRTYPADCQIVIPHIIEHFHRIDLTQKLFEEIWKRRYWSKYLLDHTEDQLTVDEYMDRGKIVWLIIEQWNSLSEAEKPAHFKVCNYGKRLHYPFTYLPKEIRPYLLDRFGKPIFLFEFDMRNCQPTILANMLVAMGYIQRSHKFVRLVESGKLYRYVADCLNVSIDVAKKETLHMIYCDPYYDTQVQFEKIFPEIAAITKFLKQSQEDDQGNIVKASRSYTLLPQMMQRDESTMFRPMWVQMIKMGYKIFPMHDAIYVANINECKAEEIKLVMEKHISNYINIRFKIKRNKIIRMI